MAENQSAEHDDRQRSRQTDVQTTHGAGEFQPLQGAEALPSYPGMLPGDSRLNGRGNQPVRNAVMLRAQQTYGNRAVSRMLQRSALTHPHTDLSDKEASEDGPEPRQPAVQRSTDSEVAVQRTPLPVQRQPAVNTGEKYNYKTPALKKELKKDLTYLTLDSISAYGEVEVTVMPKQASSSGVTVAKGAAGKGREAAIQGEINKSWDKQKDGLLDGYTPSVKLAGERKKDGGKLTVEGAAKGKTVGFGLKFNILNMEGGKIEFATLTSQAKVFLYEEEIQLADGSVAKAVFQGVFEATFTPNYSKLAVWLAEQGMLIGAEGAATFLATLLAAAAPAIAAGISLQLADLDASLTQNVTTWTKETKRAARDYDWYMNGYEHRAAGAGTTGIIDKARERANKDREALIKQMGINLEVYKKWMADDKFKPDFHGNISVTLEASLRQKLDLEIDRLFNESATYRMMKDKSEVRKRAHALMTRLMNDLNF